MKVDDTFLVQFILNLLTLEYGQFQINYNTIKDKWDVTELSSTRLVNGTGRTGTIPVRFGSSRFGCLRDGPGYSKPVHGTGRNRSFVPVYRYRFIPVPVRSVPVPVRFI